MRARARHNSIVVVGYFEKRWLHRERANLARSFVSKCRGECHHTAVHNDSVDNARLAWPGDASLPQIISALT